jgi:hypothetical protein
VSAYYIFEWGIIKKKLYEGNKIKRGELVTYANDYWKNINIQRQRD